MTTPQHPTHQTLITINHLHHIHHTLGPQTATTITNLITQRLTHNLRPTDTITPHPTHPHQLTLTTNQPHNPRQPHNPHPLHQRLTNTCNEPFKIDGHEIWATINITEIKARTKRPSPPRSARPATLSIARPRSLA